MERIIFYYLLSVRLSFLFLASSVESASQIYLLSALYDSKEEQCNLHLLNKLNNTKNKKVHDVEQNTIGEKANQNKRNTQENLKISWSRELNRNTEMKQISGKAICESKWYKSFGREVSFVSFLLCFVAFFFYLFNFLYLWIF